MATPDPQDGHECQRPEHDGYRPGEFGALLIDLYALGVLMGKSKFPRVRRGFSLDQGFAYQIVALSCDLAQISTPDTRANRWLIRRRLADLRWRDGDWFDAILGLLFCVWASENSLWRRDCLDGFTRPSPDPDIIADSLLATCIAHPPSRYEDPAWVRMHICFALEWCLKVASERSITRLERLLRPEDGGVSMQDYFGLSSAVPTIDPAVVNGALTGPRGVPG